MCDKLSLYYLYVFDLLDNINKEIARQHTNRFFNDRLLTCDISDSILCVHTWTELRR